MSKPVGPYSPIVKAGPWLITSGQVGIAAGAIVEGGVEAEFRQALANLATVLGTEGKGLSDITKTTVFLTTMDHYGAMNEIYTETFGDHRPARSAVAVHQLPLGALVEIEATAYIG